MIDRLLKNLKIQSSNQIIIVIIFVIVSTSLFLSIYNNYLINKLIDSQNILTNRKTILPIKDLIKNIRANSPKIGNPDAKVTMVIFEDFKCPHCNNFNTNTFEFIMREYINTGKVLLIHEDLAILGEESILASEAGRCAYEQGSFWEYRGILYKSEENILTNTLLKKLANDLGLNMVKFSECLDGGRHRIGVLTSKEFALNYGITSTPFFVINSETLKGALGIGSFQDIINNELEK